MRAFDSLVADGYLEIARDAQGQPIYRDGEPSYTWSEKGRKLAASGQMPPPYSGATPEDKTHIK